MITDTFRGSLGLPAPAAGEMAGYRSYRKNPFNTILLHEQQLAAALFPYILLIV